VTKTLGATPRHFQFGAGGRFVIVANQDSVSASPA
jgi:6-phosphogluconolactonase (cycloisomerase 2 family)